MTDADRISDTTISLLKKRRDKTMPEGNTTWGRKREVPIWERSLLTINEAADYTGIGVNKLRRLAEKRNSNLVIWVGSRKMFKRRKLDEYLDNAVSI